MKNAALDVNSKQTAFALLKTDGLTLTRITASPSTGVLNVTSDTTSAVTPLGFSATDENGRFSLMAVSEADGITPVALQCNSAGALLIKEI